VCLTATVGEQMKNEISLMDTNFDQILCLDFGNRRLKNLPSHYLRAPDRKWMLELMFQMKHGQTNLVFCAYRAEVHRLGKQLEEAGYSVWTCVGGEAQAFARRVREETAPDFIVATSVLSHGVNLPVLRRIFILYQIDNIDFWIQMVARGGRRGEKFEVFALERPMALPWNRVINDLAILSLSLKMKFILSLRQVQSWFLKESSSPASPTKNAT
jgi:superfamily II DNA or RNA helicase